MKATVLMFFCGIILFCAGHLIVLFMWLSRNVVHVSSTSGCYSSWSETDIQVNRAGDLLNHIARENGLSVKELTEVLMRERSSGSGIQIKLKSIDSNATTFTGVQRQANEREMISGNDSHASKRSVIYPGGKNPQILTNISYSIDESWGSFKWYMSSKESKPVNPHTYNLLINQPNICRSDNGSQDDVFLLVLMISSTSSYTQRNILRNSLFSASNISGKLVKYVFLLGKLKNPLITTKNVYEEAAKYGDIIMEDFYESFRNLTLKTLMGLKWASFYCPQAKYVLKTADDVYISFTNLIRLLEKTPREMYMIGHLYRGMKPVRDKKSKWYISKEEYPGDIFPPYFCGIGYIMSGDLPSRIFEISLTIPYIFLEDVFVGLCAERLEIIIEYSFRFLVHRMDHNYCYFKDAYVVHLSRRSQVGYYWRWQTTNATNATCEIRFNEAYSLI